MDENEELKAKNERLENQVADLYAYVEELKESIDKGDTKKSVVDPFQDLLNKLLSAMKANNENEEMNCRALLKTQYKLQDHQINQKLISTLTAKSFTKKVQLENSINLETVEPLTYLMDGWLLEGDISLLYGSYGSGKTTHALYKAYNFAKGRNILDRSTPPCKKGKSLFICTDGGVGTFKKSMNDLGLQDTDPIFKKGDKQMIFVWGYEPNQNFLAWDASVHGLLKLAKFVEDKKIDYVAIDSAKAVCSRAGISYVDNDAVRALLQYIREIIAFPNKCHIEILSHDGTAKGAHAGAKSWAEEPSMVIHLKAKKDEDTKEKIGVVADFKKDRATNIDFNRTITYKLVDAEMELVEQKEIVGSCEDTIILIMENYHIQGLDRVSRKMIVDTAFNDFNKIAKKTVDNTLGIMVNNKRLKRYQKGFYGFTESEIQRIESSSR